MKVLWFTNTFLPGADRSSLETLRHSGGWMLALCNALREQAPEVRLAVATTAKVRSVERSTVDGIDCFAIPQRNHRRAGDEEDALRACAQVVKEWAPDIIHVHGTERFFGLLLARGMISVPVVISIQGLLVPYSEWLHFFGNRSLFDIVRMHRWFEFLAMRGPLWDFYRFRKAAGREREIVAGNRYFMGRTNWDQAHLRWLNPAAAYRHVGEVIRKPFWEKRWTIGTCRRHRVVFTNAVHPRKGAEVLLAAVDSLRDEYPDVEVAIVGDLGAMRGYGPYIRREVSKRAAYVTALGPLNAGEMAGALAKAHVFVSPSFIDNSPNAVCEAQLVGLPVVSSFTGGVPSLIEHRRTGLFFPLGDAACLRAAIKEIFDSDELAVALSEGARAEARARHDPATVVGALKRCYSEAIGAVAAGGSTCGA